MKANQLREKSIEELSSEQIALLKEQFNLRMQKAAGQKTNGNQFKVVRRNIARIKTILREKGSKS